MARVVSANFKTVEKAAGESGIDRNDWIFVYQGFAPPDSPIISQLIPLLPIASGRLGP